MILIVILILLLSDTDSGIVLLVQVWFAMFWNWLVYFLCIFCASVYFNIALSDKFTHLQCVN